MFEAIVATVREPLLLLDAELRVRLANRAFCDEFRLAPADVEGSALYELDHARWNVPELRRLLEELLPEQRSFEGFYIETDPPDRDVRTLVLNARRLDLESEPMILLAIEDMTDRVRAHDDLERRVAERTADLEAFSYSVSHDLRAPLRALDGYSRALDEDCGSLLTDDGRRFLGLIRDNANHMAALIDGMLAFARLGSSGMTRRRIDVRRLVEDLLDDIRDEIVDRNIDVELGELPVCNADPILLRQVYANLVGNALKYTRSKDSPLVEIGSGLEGGERVWFVRDNGVGFDTRYAGRIFDVFQRLHRSEDYEGIGIGLALVRRIVERHGGRIWTEASEGAGAAFFFTVPEPSE